MGRWVKAVTATDITPGSAKSVTVEGRSLALYRDDDGNFYATDDDCPHEGTPLGIGAFHAGRVICASHDWVFDVRTGACLNMPGARVACYATRLTGPDVEIELDDAP